MVRKVAFEISDNLIQVSLSYAGPSVNICFMCFSCGGPDHLRITQQQCESIYVALCGTPGTLGVLLPCYFCLSMAILGNFGWARFGHGVSKVCHLICQCYIIKWHCDIICDITVLHMHWSHNLLLYKGH